MAIRFRSVGIVAAVLVCAVSAQAAHVSRDARRHFNRGIAAMEMAKSPQDYQIAAREFQQATIAAPGWSAAYKKLGLAEDKAGDYRNAVTALTRYLQLASKAPDAQSVQNMIDQDQFKAEHILTDDDALNILTSLKDKSQWEIRPVGNASSLALFATWGKIISIQRSQATPLAVVITYSTVLCTNSASRRSTSAILSDQKSIVFTREECRCLPSIAKDCVVVHNERIKVVSRNKVTLHDDFTNTTFVVGDDDFEFIRR